MVILEIVALWKTVWCKTILSGAQRLTLQEYRLVVTAIVTPWTTHLTPDSYLF